MGTNHSQKKVRQQQRRQQKTESSKRVQRLMGWTLAVVVVACVALFVVNAVSDTAANSGSVADTQTFNYEQQPALGSKDAPVKIVEFADFKCPACKSFDQIFLPQLKKEFVDTGIVQFHFMNYPIISPNADSRTAAMAGEAVFHQNPDAFWDFYEAVYNHQQDERTKWATSDTLTQIAKDANLKLDFAKLKQEIDNDTYAQAVKDDEAIARKVSVHSTPTLFINGKMVPENDTFTYSALQKAILAAKGDRAK